MRRVLLPLALGLLLSAPHTAIAQEITFKFTGVITLVREPLDQGGFAVGQVVEGSYTFVTPAADQDPSSVVGRYQNVVRMDYSVPAIGYTAVAVAGSTPGRVVVLNNDEGVRDRYVVSMGEPDQIVSGPDVAGHTLDGMSIVMRDRTTDAVSTDALPLVPPTTEQFADGAEIFLSYVGPFGGGDAIFAELTSLTVASSSPADLLNDLVDQVIGLNVQGGISHSLDAKLGAVMKAIDDSNENNDVAALNAMNAFINAVDAQRGTKLTDAEADQLIQSAQAIIAAIQTG
jgi:hypothetical protein